ncbi:MAG: Hsp20/alpha crystallin family protein [Planctomycetales bacterium]
MAIFRWQQNWGPFHDLEREVDRLLEGIRIPFHSLRVERQFPPCNLYELDEEYLLVAEVAGIQPEELELTIANGVLTIKGIRSKADPIPEERYRRRERFRGKWERSFSLPERVEEERIAAEYTDGVLKIHLPKPVAVVPRQIPVFGVASGGQLPEGTQPMLLPRPIVPETPINPQTPIISENGEGA